MWYPLAVTTPAASEPVTLVQAKEHCRIEDTASNDFVTRLITAARAHVENICGTKLVTQTIAAKCDCFTDIARLPFGPVQSISSIAYVDTDGAEQTLGASVYEARIDGLDAGIVLKYGQAWPSIRTGSRITVTAVVGYVTMPPNIVHAILMLIGAWDENREDTVIGVSVGHLPPIVAVDALLANDRLGV